MKNRSRKPKGWDLARVQDVIDHHENQTGDEEYEEIEAIIAAQNVTMVAVPNELIDEVRALLARKRVA